jgi:hypothetical protein
MMARAMTERPDLRGPSEKANHRILMICGAVGGVTGLAMALGVRQMNVGGDHPSLTTGPIPAWMGIGLALVWGVVIPVLSWRWHRVVDEHEREAYRDGAVAGFYTLSIGGGVWWFLWRGGLLPEVDAFWLYLATLTAAGLVWAWRKYR